MSKTRFPRVNDVAIRCQRKQVEAPGNRVLKTRFPIGLFSDFKACVYCLTLTLTNTHTHTHTLSLLNQSTLTLRQNRPTLTVSASPTLPLLVVSLSQPHTYTLSVSYKPEHSHRVSLTHAVACPPTLSTSSTP